MAFLGNTRASLSKRLAAYAVKYKSKFALKSKASRQLDSTIASSEQAISLYISPIQQMLKLLFSPKSPRNKCTTTAVVVHKDSCMKSSTASFYQALRAILTRLVTQIVKNSKKVKENVFLFVRKIKEILSQAHSWLSFEHVRGDENLANHFRKMPVLNISMFNMVSGTFQPIARSNLHVQSPALASYGVDENSLAIFEASGNELEISSISVDVQSENETLTMTSSDEDATASMNEDAGSECLARNKRPAKRVTWGETQYFIFTEITCKSALRTNMRASYMTFHPEQDDDADSISSMSSF